MTFFKIVICIYTSIYVSANWWMRLNILYPERFPSKETSVWVQRYTLCSRLVSCNAEESWLNKEVCFRFVFNLVFFPGFTKTNFKQEFSTVSSLSVNNNSIHLLLRAYVSVFGMRNAIFITILSLNLSSLLSHIHTLNTALTLSHGNHQDLRDISYIWKQKNISQDKDRRIFSLIITLLSYIFWVFL